MKDIKSMIIGFLMATCMFLFIGATKSDTQIGRYDMEMYKGEFGKNIYTLLDTKTGKVIEFGEIQEKMKGDEDPSRLQSGMLIRIAPDNGEQNLWIFEEE